MFNHFKRFRTKIQQYFLFLDFGTKPPDCKERYLNYELSDKSFMQIYFFLAIRFVNEHYLSKENNLISSVDHELTMKAIRQTIQTIFIICSTNNV